jgi:hypothetical protein
MIHVASHWKATIHIYNLKKFQKIQKFIAFTSACPKSLNPTYGSSKGLRSNTEENEECNGKQRCNMIFQSKVDLENACTIYIFEKSNLNFLKFSIYILTLEGQGIFLSKLPQNSPY